MTEATFRSARDGLFAGSPAAFFARIATSDNPALSYSEEFLWWSARLAGDTTFNVRVLLRLGGALDVAALERAVLEVTRRHETLRTVFPMAGGVIVRRLLPAGWVRPVVTSLEEIDPGQRESAAWRLVLEESNRPFNLSRGPLFRSLLVRLSPEHHLLQFTIHHLVIDGRSVDILLGELGLLYRALAGGRPSPLPPLPVQYAEYAAGVRRRLREGRLDAAIAYWRTRLSGLGSLLPLPTDGVRRAARHYPGGTLAFAFSAERTDALRAVARQHGVTLFVLLLGLLHLLLHRLSGSAAVAVETPLGNRRGIEAEALIGLLVDLVPLRADLTGDLTLPELLRQVRQATAGAFDHAGVPIHVLVTAVDARVDASHSAICQIMFNLIDRRDRAAHLAALDAEQVPLPDSPHSKFDMMLTAHLQEALEFQILYRRDLFSEERMAEFAAQFTLLAEQAVADPDRRVGEYSLVTKSCEQVVRRPASDPAASRPSLVAHLRGTGERSGRTESAALERMLSMLRAGECDGFDDRALGAWAEWSTAAWSLGPEHRIGVLPGAGSRAWLLATATALWSGATLWMAPDPQREGVAAWLGRDLDVVFGAPRDWRALPVDAGQAAGLRVACVAAGVLTNGDVLRIRGAAPAAACAYVSAFLTPRRHFACCQIPADAGPTRPIVPIGCGIAGTELFVLTPALQPAGIGELGRLFVGDACGVQPGRPSETPGDTGLAARYLPDGQVDCVGGESRYGVADGYVVRFDEVVSVLLHHPALVDARVEIDASGGLIAGITLRPGGYCGEDELDALVREHLPDYMAPRRYRRSL